MTAMNEMNLEHLEPASMNSGLMKMWSDTVKGKSEVNGGPVGSTDISSRACVGEGVDETSRPTAGCSTTMASGGEVDALDLGGGVDDEGSGVERCVVLEEGALLPCIGRVVIGFSEVAGMRRLSVVV